MQLGCCTGGHTVCQRPALVPTGTMLPLTRASASTWSSKMLDALEGTWNNGGCSGEPPCSTAIACSEADCGRTTVGAPEPC